jgi:hypothetical protein
MKRVPPGRIKPGQIIGELVGGEPPATTLPENNPRSSTAIGPMRLSSRFWRSSIFGASSSPTASEPHRVACNLSRRRSNKFQAIFPAKADALNSVSNSRLAFQVRAGRIPSEDIFVLHPANKRSPTPK